MVFDLDEKRVHETDLWFYLASPCFTKKGNELSGWTLDQLIGTPKTNWKHVLEVWSYPKNKYADHTAGYILGVDRTRKRVVILHAPDRKKLTKFYYNDPILRVVNLKEGGDESPDYKDEVLCCECYCLMPNHFVVCPACKKEVKLT